MASTTKGSTPTAADARPTSTDKPLPAESPLLADPEKLVIDRYGARGMLGTRRISYLIGTDGVIEDVCRAAFRLSAHRAFVARAIARYDAR